LVDGTGEHGVGRKCVSPGENAGLLAETARSIASGFLIFGKIRLLEIRAAAHQQQLETVFAAGPIKLRGAAKTGAKVVEFNCVGGIEEATGSEAVSKNKIAELAGRAAVFRVEVVVILGRAAEIHRSVALHVSAGAGGDIQHAAKTIA